MAFTLKIKRWHVVAVVAAGVLGAVGFGALEFSSSNAFCYLCHFDARFQEPWRASAHFAEGVRCKDCHFGPGVFGLVDAKWLGLKDAVIATTTAEDFNNLEIYTRAKEAKCEKCHHAFRRVNVVAGADLPPALTGKVDSLAYDHARHDEVREVCLRCHDRETSFAAVNYMTCDSCHAGLVHQKQVKYERAVPRADSCSRCHTGRLHVWGAKAEGLDDGGVFFFNDCPANERTIREGVLPAAAHCDRCHPPLATAEGETR
jgi:nitrate/TMAO reductase-like tetraheme cytochrome c subunit